jgi:hypothetical protein
VKVTLTGAAVMTLKNAINSLEIIDTTKLFYETGISTSGIMYLELQRVLVL